MTTSVQKPHKGFWARTIYSGHNEEPDPLNPQGEEDMEDETPENETPDVDIELTVEDDTSAGAKVAAALFTGAAVVGAYTIGKKAVVVGRGKIAAWKASRNQETSPPESETTESETEKK